MSSPSAPSGTVSPGPALASPGLDALLHRAAFAPIENIGWIRVSGSDRVRWLNGMVTNNIAALKPGEGNYNFFLNAQGRIQADCTAWMQEDSILLQTAADRIPALITMLDHFIIMDDVELHKMQHYHGLILAGPFAEEILRLAALSGLAVPFGPGLHHVTLSEDDNGNPFEIIRADDTLVPRFEIWCYEEKRDGILSFIGNDLNTAEVGPEDLEHLRILSGTPLYGKDIRDKDLPQETNQDARALHFAKGCYLGQEIVERIRSRGAVHRTFTGFLLTGDPATPGAALTVEGKAVGELTSVASFSSKLVAASLKLSENSLPSNPPETVQLALGYIRREVLTRSTRIQYPGGTVTPSELPFSL